MIGHFHLGGKDERKVGVSKLKIKTYSSGIAIEGLTGSCRFEVYSFFRLLVVLRPFCSADCTEVLMISLTAS